MFPTRLATMLAPTMARGFSGEGKMQPHVSVLASPMWEKAQYLGEFPRLAKKKRAILLPSAPKQPVLGSERW